MSGSSPEAGSSGASTPETVRMLLDSAKLTVQLDEFERFVRAYPGFRAQADGLYAIPGLEEEDVALNFDPTASG